EKVVPKHRRNEQVATEPDDCIRERLVASGVTDHAPTFPRRLREEESGVVYAECHHQENREAAERWKWSLPFAKGQQYRFVLVGSEYHLVNRCRNHFSEKQEPDQHQREAEKKHLHDNQFSASHRAAPTSLVAGTETVTLSVLLLLSSPLRQVLGEFLRPVL